MASDYRVAPRENSEIREIAKQSRKYFGVDKDRFVDIVACVNRPTIWTVRGERLLKFRICPDAEMGGNDGLTTYSRDGITITVARSVHERALRRIGRPRNTFAHELGHATMHDGTPLARRSEGNITHLWIRPFESAEHQTKIFAPAFLINDEIARTLPDANAIATEFGISLESARIYSEQLSEIRNRAKTAERMQQLVKQLREASAPVRRKRHYLDETCNVCQQRTIFPLGTKFFCDTCGTVYDRFQDGDVVEM